MTFPGRPQLATHRGNCSELDECKRRFKVVWAAIRARISEADIEAARRIVGPLAAGQRNGPEDNAKPSHGRLPRSCRIP
jgi:hypothetical protein